jgi:ribosomal protein S12 methylthiotransferase accessory factor
MIPEGSSLQRLYGALEGLLDWRVGIIRHVEEVPRDAGEPDFFHFWALAANVEWFSNQKNFSKGGGAAIDRASALAKAIGEAVERYCSALYDIEEFPVSSQREAPFPCVQPEEFALNSSEQYDSPGFPYLRFDRDTPVRWAPAVDAQSGENCYVPAVFLYVPYYFYPGTGDTPIAQPISTGLACHCSREEAAISAICEVIERDCFTITWQARLSPPKISFDTLGPLHQEIIRRFERAGCSVTLLNITMDTGIPTLLAVLLGNLPGTAPLVAAAATSLNPEEAARKALEELDHTRTYCQRLRNEVQRLVPEPNYENVITQRDHLNFWSDPANQQFAHFLLAGEQIQDFCSIPNLASGDPRRDVRTLVARISSVANRLLLKDITSSDVQELGLSVVRAVIPGFHPLVVGHRFRALGGTRLWQVPQQLGHRGITKETGDNPLPHPYP